MSPFAAPFRLLVPAIAFMALPCAIVRAQFTPGQVVVLETGESGVFPMNGTAITLRAFAPDGTPGAVVNIPVNGNDAMVGMPQDGAGGMSLTPAADRLVFPGYAGFAPTGTGLSTTPSSMIPRVIGTVDALGTFVRVAYSDTLLSGVAINAAASDGVNFWAAGGGTGTNDGVGYFGPGTPFRITDDPGAATMVSVTAGQLSMRGSNTAPQSSGIYDIGSGLPVDAGQAKTLVLDLPPVPGGFQFNAARDVCYAASGGQGVQKWVRIGNDWSLAYTFPSMAPGAVNHLCVDFSGTEPVIYATTFALTRLLRWVDAGAPVPATQLAMTANLWQGIAMAPGPCEVGTPCDDGNPSTINDVWTNECACAGEIGESVPVVVAPAALRAWPDPAAGAELFLNRKVDATVLDALGHSVAVLTRADRIPIGGLRPGIYIVRTAKGEVLRFVRE